MISTFSVLVENKFWVLTRIARLFSRHMFNINSLTVAPTMDEKISCMTIDVEESEQRLKRIELELKKIVNVYSVDICHKDQYVQTEMVLIKYARAHAHFKDIIKEIERFQARILYRDAEVEIAEYSGERERVEQFLAMCLKFGVQASVRTGTLAIPKKHVGEVCALPAVEA